MKKITPATFMYAADNPAALVRVDPEPNTLDDLIRDALRNARKAEAQGDRLQLAEYLWLVGELEIIKRQVKLDSCAKAAAVGASASF